MPDSDIEDDEHDAPDDWRDYADDEDEAERIEALCWADIMLETDDE
jgi:hypothetical protein